MDAQRLTKEQLAAQHLDHRWRDGFIRCARLADFLGGSILQDKYKIPDEIVNVVQLTDIGNKVLQRLVTKNDVPAKEARLLCLLNLVHREALVDFKHTDIDELERLVDRQIRDRELLYPFLLGRQLYDRAAELHEDKRDTLTHAETLKLLETMPVGIFQVGQYVSGPYGLLKSPQDRWFAPTLTVPLFHCSELTCSAIHSVRLSSDWNAPINQHHQVMQRVLDSFGQDDSEWGGFLQDLSGTDGHRYDDRVKEPLILALGDLLADDELRHLFSHLLDGTAGSLRKAVEPLGLVGRADDIADRLDRAGLVQLLLLATNDQLVEAIDYLVLANAQDPRKITIPSGEIRRLMTNRRYAYGTFGTYPELSSFGIRFTSDEYSLGPMRLKRLVDQLYSVDLAAELQELQWQLRTIDGEDPLEQLEEFVRSSEPDEVVTRLILSRRSNLLLACERLGIKYESFDDDSAFTQAVLWKLGFYQHEVTDLWGPFWEHLGRLKTFCQTAGVGARIDAVELRSKAANYFVELERVLDDTLSFATWALSSDHVGSDRPFNYEPSVHRPIAWSLLNSHHTRKNPGAEPILRDKNTLQPLISGFGVLASFLEEALVNADTFARNQEEYPRFAKHTDLKKFPFSHTMAFLDLLPRSQERILDSIRFVRETLDRADAANVRNEHMHYRTAVPNLEILSAALDAAEKAVSRLETDGLCRTLFRRTSVRDDSWGRRLYTLRSAKGAEVAFARPSSYDWTGMPRLVSGPQYVMPAAVFARPNEMLRFRPTFDTSYADYWQNYPKRRSPRGASLGARVGIGQSSAV